MKLVKPLRELFSAGKQPDAADCAAVVAALRDEVAAAEAKVVKAKAAHAKAFMPSLAVGDDAKLTRLSDAEQKAMGDVTAIKRNLEIAEAAARRADLEEQARRVGSKAAVDIRMADDVAKATRELEEFLKEAAQKFRTFLELRQKLSRSLTARVETTGLDGELLAWSVDPRNELPFLSGTLDAHRLFELVLFGWSDGQWPARSAFDSPSSVREGMTVTAHAQRDRDHLVRLLERYKPESTE